LSSTTTVFRSDRIPFLDILRGIAVLFIFFVNIQFLSGVYYYADDFSERFPTAALDGFLEVFFFIFLNGKYYYIFSFLFGIGFVVQYQNFQSRNQNFPAFFARRMLVLLAIGLFHMVFIWSGDILSIYAVLGFILLLFRDFPDKKLLKWAGMLLVMPLIHWILMYAFKIYYYYPLFDFVHEYAADLGLVYPETMGTDNPRFDARLRLEISNLSEWIQMQVVLPIQRLGLILMRGRLFKVMALFLLGLWAGRRILNDNILNDKAYLKKIAFWGFGIGLPFNILLAVLQFTDLVSGNLKHFLNHLFYVIGVASLAMGYVASLALLYKRIPYILNVFIPVGQMALTNYLSQSVIAILLFHNIGLGLYGKYSLAEVLFIAVLLFSGQILFSYLWLRFFKFGPIEWIWRQLTYWKRIQLLR
jgi:uncharacterized protein